MQAEAEPRLLTEKELGRVGAFIHVVYKAAHERAQIASGIDNNQVLSWKDKKGNKHTKLIFHIDNALVSTISNIALNMYYGHPEQGIPGLRDDPNTKEQAEEGIRIIAEKYPEEEKYLTECVDIWNRS